MTSLQTDAGDKPATLGFMASMDWEGLGLEKKQFPTPKTWANHWEPYGTLLCAALRILNMAKPAMIEKCEKAINLDGGEFLMEMIEGLEEAAEWFEGHANVLQAAACRYRCAMATVVSREPEDAS